ncbi:hypothetical protein LZ31DRAFT_29223 [Colletotrichum somersetense]|nr:hypothetical protein LZ31DRAFT_29223 [Colletotrichum somersetense]
MVGHAYLPTYLPSLPGKRCYAASFHVLSRTWQRGVNNSLFRLGVDGFPGFVPEVRARRATQPTTNLRDNVVARTAASHVSRFPHRLGFLFTRKKQPTTLLRRRWNSLIHPILLANGCLQDNASEACIVVSLSQHMERSGVEEKPYSGVGRAHVNVNVVVVDLL